MKIKIKRPNETLFAYRTEVTYAEISDDFERPDDYGITLKANGDLILKAYCTAREKPVSKKIIAINKELADEVTGRLGSILERIRHIPDSLDNDSEDGSIHYFRFFRKKISAFNPSRTDLDRIKKENFEYFKAFRDVIIYENEVLDAYDEVAELINSYYGEPLLRIAAGDSYSAPGLFMKTIEDKDAIKPVVYREVKIDENGHVRQEYYTPKEWRIRQFIKKQSWIFAKTYADRAPHEYIVRKNTIGTEGDFTEFVKYIDENGITMYFWDRPNKYIFIDGRQYWIMKGEKNEPINIINRCNLDDYKLSITWKGQIVKTTV